MTRTRMSALLSVLLMGVVGAALAGILCTLTFAYVAHAEHLPLLDPVPVHFTMGAMVLGFLMGVASAAGDAL